jgi:hypothetical protein
MSEDVVQIMIGGQSVGIMGMEAVLEEMALEYGGRDEDEVGAELLRRLSRRNYIPQQVRSEYKQAFLREFKRFLGKPVEEGKGEGLDIKVLGPGCHQCETLTRELTDLMAELNLQAAIEHVRDIKKIGTYGVMGTPALIINGRVQSVGKVPTKAQLAEWITKAQGQQQNSLK